MNKTAIKNFAIWARKKLITDITYRAGLMGITEKGIEHPLSQSTGSVQFFDIGTKEPYSISGVEIDQRRRLVDLIKSKEKERDYKTAFKFVVEEVAYTWFNRLIAIRFMEVNDYLPSRIRVLSSESDNKVEPDIVTYALELDFNFSDVEKERIIQLKLENKLDDLFRMLFIKQCNTLNDNLPELFEKTSDYSELLLNVSFTDKDGVVYHLVNDISEDDFNITKEGQIEIIGWLYQYYNTEPKDETFALLKKNVKITKERIPAATQLFTPEWIVKYMVENSLGRLWLEGHPNEELKANWKYYLEEAEQEENVKIQLEQIREEYKTIKPEDIKVIDPAMGSGHILVYAFDVLMQIYESGGYTRRDAARSIVEKNLYGLDIDTRAYQLAYFAVMMKAREYNRRILDKENRVKCNLHVIQESNGVNRNQLKYFGSHLSDMEKNTALLQIEDLLDTMIDSKEYGSIIKVNKYNWDLLRDFASSFDGGKQQSIDLIGIDHTKLELLKLIEIAKVLASKFDVVITNPPYMGNSGMTSKLSNYIKKEYPNSKSDLYAVFMQKAHSITRKNFFLAMITQHSWMFLSSLENLRLLFLENDIILMAHLGSRAFDEIGGEVVQTTSFIARKSLNNDYIAKFNRLITYKSQSEKEQAFLKKHHTFTVIQRSFKDIPGSPLSYWISKTAANVWKNSSIFGELNITRAGMITGNNDIFVRLWHEVSLVESAYKCISREEAIKSKAKWFPYSKGGEFRRWYGNNDYIVNWYNDGSYMRNYKDKTGKIPAHAFNLEYIFKENICWNSLSSYRFSARYTENGFLYDAGGSFASIRNPLHLKYFLGYLNSKVAFYYLTALNPTMNFQKGNVSDLPIIIDENHIKDITKIVESCIVLSKNDWDSFENSWDFDRHPLIRGFRISEAFDTWRKTCEVRFNTLRNYEEKINEYFINIYKLNSEIEKFISDEDVSVRKADLNREMVSFMSYAIGCLLGRYSIDVNGVAFAGGEWDDSKYRSFTPDSDNILSRIIQQTN